MKAADRNALIELYRCAADVCVMLDPDDRWTVPAKVAASHLGIGVRLAELANSVGIAVSRGREVAPSRDEFIRICLEAAQRLEEGWTP